MNLVDILENGELKQDTWSLTKPKFGKQQQLQVIGFTSHQTGSKNYILRCETCSNDPELYGEGYFKSKKGNLTISGTIPCGCAFSPRRSKEQYVILCSRKASELGYTFLGFVGEWKGSLTKIKMSCDLHGEWGSGIINNLINSNNGCASCQMEALVSSRVKPDEVMTTSFFSSGGFHSETKFWRSERKTSQGSKSYWHMSCPECGEQGESKSGSLQLGQRPCACSKQNQKEAYINWVIDPSIINTVAIKFGIARNSKHRVHLQNSKSIYDIQQHLIYKFPNVASCKKAERECKKELECGVVLKRDMPDGYTETTYVYNLDKIKEIYKKHGGVEI